MFTWSRIFVKSAKIRSSTNIVFLKESYTKVVSFSYWAMSGSRVSNFL